ncbi:hypothetical protein JOC59_001259 [Weissella beninensis]|uniref:Uncharacterized protein n=1 Tax=Periweissella beninensis TaxID=504936 RepID=A0ABT0VJN1_9LACO|nr:hypothetical protein [Periweissella beninensis]MBM7544537.1 hypothetical protein [Periweissella beninensis]MCM2438036.1 hypothetical protein [Periweissella beninensis]
MKYKLILLTLIGSFWMMVGNVHAQNNMWETIDIKQTTLNGEFYNQVSHFRKMTK